MNKFKWNFVVYGISTSQKASGFTAKDGTSASDKKNEDGNAIYSAGYDIKNPDGVTIKESVRPRPEELGENDFLRLWTWDGKGKIAPGDTDGLAFYYTEVNPDIDNFKLSANLHVNHWRIGNGQEGFGLLVADCIGKDGDTSYHWTNSYMAAVSRVDYKWDDVNNDISDYDGTDITLRIGIGSIAKTGVTAENLPVFENDVVAAVAKYYDTQTLPLETSVHTDKYNNIIGNEALGSTEMVPEPIVDLKLSIELNETGYFVSYTQLTKNADGSFTEGETVTNKYYDRNALSMCEKNTVYVGFFATRFADVTYSNVSFTTSRYDPEKQPERRPDRKVKLRTYFSGASTANGEDYNLIYNANWKGTVTITDEAGTVLKQDVMEPKEGKFGEEVILIVPVKLHIGINKFKAIYNPVADYDPCKGRPHTILTSYEPEVSTFSVDWKKFGEESGIIYVAPDGRADGDGSKASPLDIYTAVKYAQPAQSIYLTGGIYSLTKTVNIDRGINGTKDKMIYMLADPETCNKETGARPVFDFNSQCIGMVVAGDWWHLKGFDVTRSGNHMQGIRVSGNHNILEGLNIYKNGNTGLQISKLLDLDKFDNWPSYNLILNCTSCLNADAGYTDADGFAAKLSAGNGNVFDGCISAFNADDGWDLFAKVQSGNIGMVTIKNCVSFDNGRVIRDKVTHELVWFDESDNYEIVEAGSGNGYKLGGSSLSGHHTLKNSVAFHNRLKGIDSNSCNDIQVYGSISFDNESHNVAMYSSVAKTDFKANGVISYRKNVAIDVEDQIGVKVKDEVSSIINTQDDCACKIFNNTNFFWNKLISGSEPGPEYYRYYTTCTDEASMKESFSNCKPSISVSDEWFESLDYEKWINENCQSISSLGRNEDGTINLNGFLELSDIGKARMAEAGAGAF
ncbi:MAG: hypothetical protein K2K46_12295 [Lachnospiraceae bacterium]|nr:hypothetical protein [Lachnospiraceae bacterium]